MQVSGITATTIARRAATANRLAAGPSSAPEEADDIEADQEDVAQVPRRRTRGNVRYVVHFQGCISQQTIEEVWIRF